MRCTELRAGDRIQIGPVTITLEDKTGRKARMSISTDHDLAIKIIPCGQPVDSDGINSKPVEPNRKTG